MREKSLRDTLVDSPELSSGFPPAFARLRGSARLVVYIDLKSPYAHIAIQPTRDVAEMIRWILEDKQGPVPI